MEPKLTKKQQKSAKFLKKKNLVSTNEVANTSAQAEAQDQILSEKKVNKTKKTKKSSEEAKSTKTKADQKVNNEEQSEIAESTASTDTDAAQSAGSSSGKKRFLVFVGNLPYTTTKEELQEFFSAAEPYDIRLISDKVTKKPKGFAFVEFSSPLLLKKALKYHKMDFKGRKINVEFTVGGGGNSEQRRNKIDQKRKNLGDERAEESSTKQSPGESQGVRGQRGQRGHGNRSRPAKKTKYENNGD